MSLTLRQSRRIKIASKKLFEPGNNAKKGNATQYNRLHLKQTSQAHLAINRRHSV